MKFIVFLLLFLSISLPLAENNLEDMREALRENNFALQTQTLQQILLMYEKAAPLLPELVHIVKTTQGQTQYLAVRALGHVGSQSSPYVDDLVALYKKSNDFSLRYYIIIALGDIKSKRPIHVITNALKDKDPNMRSAAIWSLNNISPNNFIEILKKHAADPSAIVQKTIISSLRLRPYNEDVSQILIPSLKHPDKDVRFLSTQLFRLSAQNFEQVKPLYLELLNSPDNKVAMNVLIDFGMVKELSQSVVPNIIKLLKHKNLYIYAETTLGKIGKPCLPHLKKLLDSTNDLERSQAVSMIKKINCHHEFMLRFTQMCIEDKSNLVHRACLGAIRSPQSVPKEITEYIKKQFTEKETLERSISAISALNLDIFVPQLKELWKNNTNLRKVLYRVLGKFAPKHPEILEILLQAFTEDEKTAKWAMVDIGTMGEKGAPAVEKLIEFLNKEKFLVMAANTLKQIGPKSLPALPRLAQIFHNDPKRRNKHAALHAMISIGDEATPHFLKGLDSTSNIVRLYSVSGLKKVSATDEVWRATEKALAQEKSPLFRRYLKLLHKHLQKQRQQNKGKSQ
ncbi:HEAT repeat domain-containing protein [Candidatus Uabimicrobium amorphum]|uniref:HEAT repeat domain-containing protein n=1 Tax=Uabimicrobium amorphum TaxID=2596890 RepID=A0A5S9IL76_UABAM|nr:HEAT repeat domain-containing protein [Candidatus Uabimicrobium amorphum]BBM83923.1 hypothetical protein UABAM_02278 [Candidatus Uabimicrobium amorphum]